MSLIKYYDIVENPIRGKTVVFNNYAVKKIEDKRCELLMNHCEFAKHIGVARRSLQKCLYNENVGFKIAKIIISKVLN